MGWSAGTARGSSAAAPGTRFMGTCTAPSMCPATHSSSSRTSRTTASAGRSSTDTVGTSKGFIGLLGYAVPQSAASGARAVLLEPAGQPPVGQLPALGLAGRAVLERPVGEGHRPDRVAAHRARQPGPRVHPQAAALLAFQGGRALADRSFD